MLSLTGSLLLFTLTAFGLAWPLVARRALAPADKLLASVVLSLTGLWLGAWAVCLTGLPWAAVWLLPLLALGGCLRHRLALTAMFRDGPVRACLLAQLLVSLWCLGWLCLVENYSGGGWTSDWFEHWQRAQHFLNREPAGQLFLGIYPLTARPPLANVVMAAWLQLTGGGFPHYQLFSTLFATLSFLPAALLAMRFAAGSGGDARRSVALLTLLFMANPLFVQNAVFPWTKLPAALFVLAALHFYLRHRDDDAPGSAALLFAVALAAGLLTHYSAAPYAVALGLGWILLRPADWHRPDFRRQTLVAGAVGFLLLASWFGWAFATFGFAGTLGTNTSVTTVAGGSGSQLARVILNLRDTLVPHFLRSPDTALIAQSSPWGYLRDWFFQSYQLNLFFALGSVGWLVILREAWKAWRDGAPPARRFWLGFVLLVAVLGVVTHGARDEWGLAHICLQGLVLLGLAWLAGRWSGLSRPWRLTVVAGVTLDLLCGIVLHFAVQSHALDRWFTPERTATEIVASYNHQTLQNLIALMVHRLETFNGTFAPPYAVVTGLLALGLAGAIARLHALARPLQPARAGAQPLIFRLALAGAAGGAIACLWQAWCAFPSHAWNELRLAPAFALREGLNPYPLLGDGPLTTWIYGPVGILLNLPATLADSPLGALQLAGVITALTIIAPLAVVFFTSAELRARHALAPWFALAFVILLLPRSSFEYLVPDHGAIALGLLSGWCLTRRDRPSPGWLAAAAGAAVLAISAKQIAVGVVLAHLAYLALDRQFSALRLYLAWFAAIGLAATAVWISAFGFSNLWLNLVEIPGRLPWVSSGARLRANGWLLVAQLLVPLLGLVALRLFHLWPDRIRPSGRFFHFSVLAFLAMLPLGAAAFLKIGGAPNSLHSWAYLLPGALLLWLVRDTKSPRASPRLLLATLAALALRGADLIDLPARPVQEHFAAATQITVRHPHAVWFPQNPIIGYYHDRILWHSEDGLVTRYLAGYSLDDPAFRRFLPAKLTAVAYPADAAVFAGMAHLPEFTRPTGFPHWRVFTRTPGS